MDLLIINANIRIIFSVKLVQFYIFVYKLKMIYLKYQEQYIFQN